MSDLYQFPPDLQEPPVSQQKRAEEIYGQISTVTTAPTDTPKTFQDQFRVYVDSTSSPTVFRLYYYNTVTNAWKFVTNIATITESDITLSDVTTADASTSKHGFLPKIPNDYRQVLSGKDGTWGFDPLISHPYAISFETAGRYVRTTTGAGSITWPVAAGRGPMLACGGGGAGSASVTDVSAGGVTTLGGLYNAGGAFKMAFQMTSLSGTGSIFLGFGAVTVGSTGHTFTNKHIGLKVLISGGLPTLYASCADGTTESATSMTTVNGADDVVEVAFKIISSSSVKFWFRKNRTGDWVSTPTEITTNIPTTFENTIQWSISNDNTSNNNQIEFLRCMYI